MYTIRIINCLLIEVVCSILYTNNYNCSLFGLDLIYNMYQLCGVCHADELKKERNNFFVHDSQGVASI